tara:strand:- start:716 stop:976 length:261 start_codon:yes stop_codon:yes gene_type:complete
VLVSIEISLYPLNTDFIPAVDDLIDRLQCYQNIEVRTNVMSTHLFGDLNDLMEILKLEIDRTFNRELSSVFSIKIVNGDSRKYGEG